MGLKAGWLALFMFIWVIGAFLGSTFDYHSAAAETGQTYSTGNATFTTTSDVVTSGGGAVWVVGMEEGNIQATADAVWYKIKHIGGGYLTNYIGVVTGSPQTLAIGANAVTITRLGSLVVVIPAGNTGTATSGVCTVVGSPQALVAGTNIVETTGVVGAIDVTTVGTTQLFLYTEYLEAGGAGLAYTMRPTPGWAGSSTGTGGYSTSPVSKLEYIINLENAFQRVEVLGFIPLPKPNGEYFKTIFQIITLRFSFIIDNYEMIWWIVLLPIVAMGVLTMVLLVYGILTGNISW